MAESQEPFDWRAKRDWIAFLVCFGIGMIVTEVVGEAVLPSLGFWPTFAVKVAAGGAVTIAALMVWMRLIRPRL
jgi:hypothetical protein